MIECPQPIRAVDTNKLTGKVDELGKLSQLKTLCVGFRSGQEIQARVGAKVEIAMEGSIANVGSLDCNR